MKYLFKVLRQYTLIALEGLNLYILQNKATIYS